MKPALLVALGAMAIAVSTMTNNYDSNAVSSDGINGCRYNGPTDKIVAILQAYRDQEGYQASLARREIVELMARKEIVDLMARKEIVELIVRKEPLVRKEITEHQAHQVHQGCKAIKRHTEDLG